jgi:hypothetical protein
MDSLPGQINPYTALSYQDHLRSTFDLSCSQVIDAARRPLAWLYLLQAVEASVTWTPKTEPVLMRASLSARLGQEKPHETQAPQPRTDHPQAENG